jgi:mRNA interferase RelE/StbE
MSTIYSILISREAAKYLQKLDNQIRSRILTSIQGLSITPPQGDIVAMKSMTGCYRLRVGSYRVIFSVDHKDHSVLIKAIGPRGSIY